MRLLEEGLACPATLAVPSCLSDFVADRAIHGSGVMATITAAVGKWPAKNLIADVRTVQELLNSVGPANGGPSPPLAVVLVHERAHTVLNLHGHPSSDGPFHAPICVAPHEGDPLIRYPQSMQNAWCYEWLTGALQPHYTAARFGRLDHCEPAA